MFHSNNNQGHDLISHRQHNKRSFPFVILTRSIVCLGRAPVVEMDERMSRDDRIVIPSPACEVRWRRYVSQDREANRTAL